MNSLFKDGFALSSLDDLVPVSSKWHVGNLIAFSHIDGSTDYEEGLVLRTIQGGLLICFPVEAILNFAFSSPVVECRVTSDFFEVSSQSGESIRGVLVDAYHLLLVGSLDVEVNDPHLRSLRAGDRMLIGSKSHFCAEHINDDFDAIATRRLQWFVSNKDYCLNVPVSARFAIARALSQMKGQVCSPEGRIQYPWTTPDRWPHRNMWLWDTAFHAIGWRHINPRLAQEMLSAMLSVQASDGFIPHMASPEMCTNITQPPVLALAAQLVFEKSLDSVWLAAIYPKLCAYVEWNAKNRDKDGAGLLEWCIDDDPFCRSGESGMDNSPRFDDAVDLDAIDFNAYQAGEYEVLAQFASLLNKPDEAEKWEQRYKHLCAIINQRLWSEEHGLYFDLDPKSGELTNVFSSAGFLPLYCGAAEASHAARLVEHLKNPNTFGQAFPLSSSVIPCEARSSSSAIQLKDMWRGPTWININWLVARGLARYGYHAEAEMLRMKTITELERTCEKWGTFFEYFDDCSGIEPPALNRKGKNIPGNPYHQVVHDYGWSATLYVDWLLS